MYIHKMEVMKTKKNEGIIVIFENQQKETEK